jgi:hypothetical protein
MGEASVNELPAMLDRQRRAFVADGPPSVAVRRDRIDRLMALLLDNTDAFVEAMAADYGTRSEAASLFTEVVGIISVVEHTRSDSTRSATIDRWWAAICRSALPGPPRRRSGTHCGSAPTLHCGLRGCARTVGSNAATRTPPDQLHAQLVERN